MAGVKIDPLALVDLDDDGRDDVAFFSPSVPPASSAPEGRRWTDPSPRRACDCAAEEFESGRTNIRS
jgi:hypothetical protein